MREEKMLLTASLP